MRYEDLDADTKIDVLGENFKMMQDNIAALSDSTRKLQDNVSSMIIFKKCAERLYSDEDGFEGDIPEVKNHLKTLNGRMLTQEQENVQRIKDIEMCKWDIKEQENNLKVAQIELKWKQILQLVLIAVSSGGGTVLLSDIIKSAFGL